MRKEILDKKKKESDEEVPAKKLKKTDPEEEEQGDEPMQNDETVIPLKYQKEYYKFSAFQFPSLFDIAFNQDTERYEIKAKRDLPPYVYMFHEEAYKLKLAHPDARRIDNNKYVQLWKETLPEGAIYTAHGPAEALSGATKWLSFKYTSVECLTVDVPKGYYPKPEYLVKALNKETKHPLADWEKSEQSGGKEACGYRFGYSKEENRIVLGLAEYTDLTFNKDLHTLLGFENIHYKEKRQTAKHPPLLTRGIYHIYVYCDLCAEVQVGNMLVPLLRTIEVPTTGDEWGRVTCIRFQRPMYIPVIKLSFNSVKIELYDDMGRRIPFTEGRTVVTLHLRPRQRL